MRKQLMQLIVIPFAIVLCNCSPLKAQFVDPHEFSEEYGRIFEAYEVDVTPKFPGGKMAMIDFLNEEVKKYLVSNKASLSPIRDELSFGQSVYDPSMPVFQQLDKQTAMLSIPSFLIEKSILDKVLSDNRRILTSVKHLLEDIRGNGGGNGIYFGYPMYTLHDRIPDEGYNRTGIVPDVWSDQKADQLIDFALEQLKK